MLPDLLPIASREKDEPIGETEQRLDDNCSNGDQATASDHSIALREAYWFAVICGSVHFSGILMRAFALDLDTRSKWCKDL
jgi:hypothetical protein